MSHEKYIPLIEKIKYPVYYTDKDFALLNGGSAIVLKQFPDNCIDLTCTSPPYDQLRTYKGFTFDFPTIAKELYRVTKDGRCCSVDCRRCNNRRK